MEAPSTPIVRLTREHLYELVWSTPVARLARQYGISDVALAKLCRRRNIPRPPRGHWARLAAGQVRPRAMLPPAQSEEDRPAMLRLVAMIPPAVMPATGERLHPVAEKVRRCLYLYKKDPRGLVCLDGEGLPSIAVSPALADKVVAIVHVLLTHAERRRWVVNPLSAAGGFEMRRGRRVLAIRIEEQLAPAARTADGGRRRPVGRLCLAAWRRDAPAARTRRWTEAEGLPFEHYLGRLIDGFFVPAHAVHRQFAAGGCCPFPAHPDEDRQQVA